MGKKHDLPDKTVFPSEDNWADFTVNLNDGWADDVSLIYPEGSWRPDDEELTIINMEENESENSEISSENITDVQAEKAAASDKKGILHRKSNPFRTFLILWLGTLSIVIAVALGYFYDFLVRYEAAYQASRPALTMDTVLQNFEEYDMNAIYHSMTTIPQITPFESELNVQNHMLDLILDKNITYVKTEKYTEDFPEYYITADDYIVATVVLRKSPVETMEYNFPVWYVSSFDYYTDAQFNFRIEAPSNCNISVNGIPLGTEYCYEDGIVLDAAAFVEPYTTLPTVCRYYCEGLYENPVITATNTFGEPVDVVLNTSTGFYEIGFGSNPEEEAQMQAFAIEAVSVYANYISNDATEAVLDSYFIPDCEILPLIKTGTTAQYFVGHSRAEIENEQVTDFIYYNENAFYCEVTLDQLIYTYYSSEPDVVTVTGRFYFVRTEEGWKICGIRF